MAEKEKSEAKQMEVINKIISDLEFGKYSTNKYKKF